MNDDATKKPSEADLVAAVLECLRENYGLAGDLQRLPGENLNFLVSLSDGSICGSRKYVFKIVDEHMPPEVVELEFAAITHAAAAGFRPRLPRIIENKYGKIETQLELPKSTGVRKIFRGRIISFLAGSDLSSISDISNELLENVGVSVAEFARAMQDFDHPAAHRNHRWNLAESLQHEDKIELIEAPEKRELLTWAFGIFRAVRPALDDLPWQFIHGDAHDENLLVAGGRVVGLIDFGDCCHNPTVGDLAICLTYLMMRGDNPLAIARAIRRGYESVRPLLPAERDVLYPLICGRLAVSLCIANARKRIDPDNPNWFGGEARTWRFLRVLQELKDAGRAL